MLVEVLGGVFEEGRPTGGGGHVDETVHGSEPLGAGVDDRSWSTVLGDVGGDEQRRRPRRGQFGGEGVAAVGRPAGQDQAGRAGGGELAGDGLAEPLGAAVDDRDAHGAILPSVVPVDRDPSASSGRSQMASGGVIGS